MNSRVLAYLTADETAVTDWRGTETLGQVVSRGPVQRVNSPFSATRRSYYVRTLDGRSYYGRSYGGGMSIILRPFKR